MIFSDRILIVDDDPSTEAELAVRLHDAGLDIDTARDGITAMQKLSCRQYAAIIITPLIRHGLNGFAVLSFIEQDHAEMLSRVFVLTVLPKETIKRIAPAVLSRCFKRAEYCALAQALVEFCGRTTVQKQTPSILVVEDDAETARIECEILRALGYACRWVCRGSDVLVAIRSARFDALLLDVVLPDFDGVAILKALQTTQPDLLRRVVVVTGLPHQYLDEIRDYPVCGILAKPVDARRLESLLSTCASGN